MFRAILMSFPSVVSLSLDGDHYYQTSMSANAMNQACHGFLLSREDLEQV
jgi:hypothetical protein